MNVLKKMIQQLMDHQELTRTAAYQALSEILAGAPNEQIAAFLVLLHAKGETPAEMEGLIKAMLERMKTVKIEGPILDIVGTGGDAANTVNISTAASLLAAACGARVVKHGNRSVSSRCGSADVLESLGFRLDSTPQEVIHDVKRRRFAFCFSPNFHPAMEVLKNIRSALGVRTSFNLLGPLLNPARAQHLLIGVFSPHYLDLLADTLLRLKVEHAMLVHSCGLDEISLLGPTDLVEVIHNKKCYRKLDPKEFGFQYCTLAEIQGGDIQQNTAILKRVFRGGPGPIADTIILNAAVGLYVSGTVSTIELGIERAAKVLRAGNVLEIMKNA